MSGSATTQGDSAKDFGSGDEGLCARWQAEIKAADKVRQDWLSRCDRIERRYRDDELRDDTLDDPVRISILWSNIQTLKPAVYSRPPVPVVTRRFRDRDPVARAASMILQRTLAFQIDDGDMHQLMREVVDDYLLYARGTCWARYCPHYSTTAMPGRVTADAEPETPPASDGDWPDFFGREGMPSGAEYGGQADEGEQVGEEAGDDAPDWEEVQWDFVHRRDFLHGPGNVWKGVKWVARDVRLTRDAMVERFGRKARTIPLTWKPGDSSDDKDDKDDEVIRRAEVTEVWCRETKTVYWFANARQEIVLLDKEDDPLGLRGFFPTPRPLFGTLTSGSLVPIPDYDEYRGQAQEMDELTARIAALTSAIKVAGVYDERWPELARIFDEGAENQLIGITSYAEFAAKSGMSGAIDLIPMLDMIKTLGALIEARTAVKADLYEVTGIADVIRGSTAPQETATAQRIKGRYATLRLSDRQFEVARYVRDVLRITGEIVCEQFSPETLRLASNFDQSQLGQANGAAPPPPMMGHNGGPPMGMPGAQAPQILPKPSLGTPSPISGGFSGTAEPPLFDRAVALLKNDKLRGFAIDIEDQSTIAMDDEAEKMSRVQFIEGVGKFIESIIKIPPAMAPALIPMLGKMLLFGARGFRAGLEMETVIEDAIERATAMVEKAAAAPPPPNPDMIRAETDAKKAQADVALAQADQQLRAQVAQAEMATKAAEAQATAQEAAQDRWMKNQEMMHNAAQQGAQNAQDSTQHQIAIDAQMLAREKLALDERRLEFDTEMGAAKLLLEQARLELDREALKAQAKEAKEPAE